MFFGSAARATVPQPAVVTERMATARLASALEHLLGLQRAWATSCGDVAARSAVRELEKELGIASRPEELAEVAVSVLSIAPPSSTTANAGISAALASRVAGGIAEVAQRLELAVVREEAEVVARRETPDGEALVGVIRRLTEAVGQVRRAHAIVDGGIGDVAQGIAAIRSEDAVAARSAAELRTQVGALETAEQLAACKESLVEVAARLEETTRARAEALAALEKQARDAQARAAQLMEELADAAQAACTDKLTGLGNRRALEEAVRKAGSDPRTFGVVAIDIDFFKKVNDTHGHAAGDAVLQHVAGILASEIRGEDTAFRCGGEEFVALLAACDGVGAARTAERVRARIEALPARLPSGPLRVTASFGVATWGGGGSFEAAVEKADKALYSAKEMGRNRVCRG